MVDVDLTEKEREAFALFYTKIKETTFYEKKTTHTQVMKSELTELKNCINSITSKNKNDILVRLRKLITVNKKTINNDSLIMNTLFNNFTVNSFYSKEYAEIYLNLCKSEPDLFIILSDAIKNINEKYYARIIVADPDTSYSLFCENNKTNELIRSFTHFVVALFGFTSLHTELKNIINEDYLFGLVLSLIEKIKNTENYLEAYEYLENINIFFKNIPEIRNKQHANVQHIVHEINEMKNKKGTYVYFKNKCIFKCMDILEIINI